MNLHLVIIVLGTIGLAAIVTRLMIVLAPRWHVVDDPGVAPGRKRHQGLIPLLGGWAVIIACVSVLWGLEILPWTSGLRLPMKQLIGISIAAVLIMIGGAADDRWRLSPRQQLVAPILAVLTIVASGIGISEIRNPFGGMIHLDTINLTIFTWHGLAYHVTLWADVFTAGWLLVTMYATKLLDGLDGLVSGVGVIGSVAIYLLTLRPEVNQPDVGALAVIFGAACLGFLFFNWNPAKIFLGESGSLFVGFVLGILAIIAGGKLGVALLILGLPILDLLFVVLYRRFVLHQSPLHSADRSHLHFRLLDQGWSVRRTVLFLYGVVGVFGLSTLFVHGITKVITLGILGVFMVFLVMIAVRRAPPTQQT